MQTMTRRNKRRLHIVGHIARTILLPFLLVVIGASIMGYPVVASQWNSYQQQEILSQQEEKIQEIEEKEPGFIDKSIEKANAYNDSLSPAMPILDPWDSRISEDNADYKHYLSHLTGLPTMGQITIPSINSSLPIYHGTSTEALEKGVGHLYGTSLPVGGEKTHTALTGHTGLPNSTMWDNLVDVKEGDSIIIETFGETLAYKVTELRVVLPDETDSIIAQQGKDMVTLITCTPYGVNTHRLLVEAERVPVDEEVIQEAKKTTGFTIQWWMWAVITFVGLVLIWMIWKIISVVTEYRKEKV